MLHEQKLLRSLKLKCQAAEKKSWKNLSTHWRIQKLIEFDELIKKRLSQPKEALEKISNAMKFDSTKGIPNDAVTSLIVLKDQGEITGDELQASLRQGTDGKELWVFETNARAAFAGTAKERKKNAQITEAVMRVALERTGLSTEQLQENFHLHFSQHLMMFRLFWIKRLDEYKAKGIDTEPLSSNLNKAIDTAQTRAELDYVKSKLLELEQQGIITGKTGWLLNQVRLKQKRR